MSYMYIIKKHLGTLVSTATYLSANMPPKFEAIQDMEYTVNTALNDTCRIITGSLKPTPVGLLYPLDGVAPPDVRRNVASSLEVLKMRLTRGTPCVIM